MYHFLQKVDNKLKIKLNIEVYNKSLFDQIRKEDPRRIKSVKTKNGYFFVELNVKKSKDYLDFLNYLIYLERSR